MLVSKIPKRVFLLFSSGGEYKQILICGLLIRRFSLYSLTLYPDVYHLSVA